MTQDDAQRQHMEWMNRMARDACQEVDGYEATRAAQEANINCEVGYEHLNVAAQELRPPYEHMTNPIHRVERHVHGKVWGPISVGWNLELEQWSIEGVPYTPAAAFQCGYRYLYSMDCFVADPSKEDLITQLQARLHGYQEMIDRTAHANDVLFQSYTRRIQELEAENFALKQIPYGWDREQRFREASDHMMQAADNYISDLERRLAVTEDAATDRVGPSNPINDRANEVIGDLLNRRIVEPTRKELRRALDVADKPETGRLPDGTHRAPNSGAFR
jgi:hypothetical protein